MHRHTILRFPRMFHVTLLYRLPHSPQIMTSVRAYLEYLPEAVMDDFCDTGAFAFLLADSSWALLKISRVMMAGWLFSTSHMGASPSFAFRFLEIGSMVTVFCRMASPQYFSFFNIRIIMDLLKVSFFPGMTIFSACRFSDISSVDLPERYISKTLCTMAASSGTISGLPSSPFR